MSSSSAPTNTKTIKSIDGTQGSSVFTPSLDDQCILPLSPTSVPSSPYYTPATPHTDDESESFEVSETRVTSSPSPTTPADPTSPPSPQTHHVTWLLSQADRGDGIITFFVPEEDETASESEQQQAIPAKDIVKDEPLGLCYKVARHHALERAGDTVPSTYEGGQILALPLPVGTPASPEWFLESPPVSPVIPLLVASPALDEGSLLEIEAQIELDGSILLTHNKRLDVLPPSRFEGYDRDVTELFSRIVVVHEDIHSQRFRLKSLERVQEETGLLLAPYSYQFCHLSPGQGIGTPKGELYGRPSMKIGGRFVTCGGSTRQISVRYTS
nr:hypothetical protein [Tanacetum cinerariifolium]